MIESVATGLAMAVTIAGAMVAAGARSIVHAIIGFAIALAGVAAAFALLNSPFVAAMEVLIYIGGITVAMVFAVMLSSIGQREPKQSMSRHVVAFVVSIMFLFSVGSVLMNAEYGPRPETTEAAWSVEAIGTYLLNEFNVAFEMLSLVLLVAIVGAITIAGHKDESIETVVTPPEPTRENDA